MRTRNVNVRSLMTDKPLTKKLDELYGLIEGIEIAMMTTKRADGSLEGVVWRRGRRTRLRT